MKYKAFLFLLATGTLMVLFSMCINKPTTVEDPRGKMYAGMATCRQCHQTVYDNYLATAHNKATQPASAQNIHGSFQPGANMFSFNDSAKIKMEKRDSGFYQVLFTNGKEAGAYRFDVVFGNRHAQTYLYWKDRKTYEMPVSYLERSKSWVASPGFSADAVNFKRFVGKDCYECHSSFIESTQTAVSIGNLQEQFEESSLVFGIDCERCHGPAASHVNFHRLNPGVSGARFIVKSLSLSRQQKLDACAVCHSGNDKVKELSTFRFIPGDTLANYFSPWSTLSAKQPDFDVHGNQYQLLAESRCFTASNAITCSTCHDPHKDSNSPLVEYSRKCISCHMDTKHVSLKLQDVEANDIQKNCIDCHMPQQPSRAISFLLNGTGEKASYMLRTHRIGVYQKLN